MPFYTNAREKVLYSDITRDGLASSAQQVYRAKWFGC
jgi:hypothetical protein